MCAFPFSLLSFSIWIYLEDKDTQRNKDRDSRERPSTCWFSFPKICATARPGQAEPNSPKYNPQFPESVLAGSWKWSKVRIQPIWSDWQRSSPSSSSYFQIYLLSKQFPYTTMTLSPFQSFYRSYPSRNTLLFWLHWYIYFPENSTDTWQGRVWLAGGWLVVGRWLVGVGGGDYNA